MNETSRYDNVPIINQLARKDMDRIKTYKELLDFYQGGHWDGSERRG